MDQPVGISEFQWNRQLSIVRAQSIRQRRGSNERRGVAGRLAESRLGNGISALQNDFRKTVIGQLSVSKAGNECVICYMEIENGDKVVTLPCFETHMFHEECYDNFQQSYDNRGMQLLCPYCRTSIDKNAVVKKIIQIEVSKPVEVHEAFALDDGKKVEMVDVAASDMKSGNADNQLIQPPAGDPVSEPNGDADIPGLPDVEAPADMPPAAPPAGVLLPPIGGPPEPVGPDQGYARGNTVHIEDAPPMNPSGGDDAPEEPAD